MLGLNASLRAVGRERRIAGAIAALIAVVTLVVLAPSSARASGCENSWASNKTGSWFKAENWSKKAVPSSSEEVCITENGSYTVEVDGTSAVSVKSLTVGALTGTQTLAIDSTCSVNASLATTAGLTIGAQGAVTMSNADSCGDSDTLIGPVTNSGTITTITEHGGNRTLQGNLSNKGTLQLNQTTAFDESGTTLTNEGALNVAEGKQLAVSNKAAVTNAGGGNIAGTAGSNVFLSSGTTFNQGAGTTSGTLPVYVDDGTLNYSGGGAGSIAARGSDTLTGNLAAGQSLVLQSTCGENATVTASASYTNAGAITLTNGDSCGNSETLKTSSGTLSNSGTITTEHEHGGNRTLQGNLTNSGTIALNQNTSYNVASAALLNEGAIDLAEGVQLAVSNAGSVTNGNGGSVVATGSANVLMGSGTSFTEGAGTTSGTQPVIVDDGTLTYTGSGASLVRLRGTTTLSGASAAGQKLSIESTCSENATATASPTFANGGSITMTNGDSCGNSDTLAGTVTNGGTITTEPERGGNRNLQGSLTNKGTIQINTNSAFNGSKGLLTNEGAIDVAESKQLSVSSESTVTNTTGGSINGTGSGNVFLSSGTIFNQGAGTTSGTLPVYVDDGTLNYTGGGAGSIAARGSDTLTGNLAAGQSLTLQSTCGENATVTASASYTNAGAITLTNGDSCGNSETLTTSSGTLSNSGTITTEHEHGGNRTLQGNLTNSGTIAVNQNTSYNTATTLLNEGAIDVANGVAFSVSSGATVTNEAGSINGAGSGVLAQTGGTFNEGGGATSGSQPVVLDDLALHYTGKGTGPIALRGTSTLSGTINAGQALTLQSTCGENAVVSAAASFTSSGTIALANGDGCGNSDTLKLPAKDTLTNKGTISSEHDNGGNRTLELDLKNEGALSLGAGQTLKVVGTLVQSGLGTLKVAVASASSFGSLAVSSTAKVAGALVVTEVEPFVGKAGETFAVLSSSKLTGTLTDLDGVVTATPGRYYLPSYSATGVTLTDTQATLKATPEEGAAGSKVTLTGSGFQPKDKIKLTFTDAKKVKTTFPTVTVGAGGELSAEVTLSTKAAKGAGTFTATSTNVTGLAVTTGFTVS